MSSFRETRLEDLPDYSYLDYTPPPRYRYELFATVGYPIPSGTNRAATFTMLDRSDRRDVRSWGPYPVHVARHVRERLIEYVRMRNDLDQYYDWMSQNGKYRR